MITYSNKIFHPELIYDSIIVAHTIFFSVEKHGKNIPLFERRYKQEETFGAFSLRCSVINFPEPSYLFLI